jgi:hypothetical protein
MRAATVSEVPVIPILVSISTACAMIGRGTAAIYNMIGQGKIKAVKSDGRTLVVVSSLHEYADNLPPAKISPPARRPPARTRATA